MMSVTFDGENKLILVISGTQSLNVKSDIYSEWKRWIVQEDYMKFEKAMSVIGGEPTIQGNFVGSTFFLENGWRIKPYSGSYELIIDGNLYTTEGSSSVVPADGINNNVLVTSQRSNLVDTIGVNSAITLADIENIANSVWNYILTNASGSGSAGQTVIRTERKTDDNQALIISI